jgi:hypothetical protein
MSVRRESCEPCYHLLLVSETVRCSWSCGGGVDSSLSYRVRTRQSRRWLRLGLTRRGTRRDHGRRRRSSHRGLGLCYLRLRHRHLRRDLRQRGLGDGARPAGGRFHLCRHRHRADKTMRIGRSGSGSTGRKRMAIERGATRAYGHVVRVALGREWPLNEAQRALTGTSYV